LTVNIFNSFYHYTTESARLAIIESGVLRPSLDRGDNTDVRYGEGQYFTNLAPEMIACKLKIIDISTTPETIACQLSSEMTEQQKQAGQISLKQLSARIMDGAIVPLKLHCFIEFDVSNLIIERTESSYIYLHRSRTDLDISNLIIRSGETPR
jgi:HYD1 signature containing ADP-ribosyltransferase